MKEAKIKLEQINLENKSIVSKEEFRNNSHWKQGNVINAHQAARRELVRYTVLFNQNNTPIHIKKQKPKRNKKDNKEAKVANDINRTKENEH